MNRSADMKPLKGRQMERSFSMSEKFVQINFFSSASDFRRKQRCLDDGIFQYSQVETSIGGKRGFGSKRSSWTTFRACGCHQEKSRSGDPCFCLFRRVKKASSIAHSHRIFPHFFLSEGPFRWTSYLKLGHIFGQNSPFFENIEKDRLHLSTFRGFYVHISSEKGPTAFSTHVKSQTRHARSTSAIGFDSSFVWGILKIINILISRA